MKKTILWISLLLLFSYGPVSAEFYKYTDADGNVRYTDDLSKVPESQRPNVTSYEESDSSAPTAAPKTKTDNDEKADKAAEEAAIDANASLNEQRSQIQVKQDNLNKEFKALMDEKAKLSEASMEKMTVEQRVELDRKVENLNKKISKYDDKRKALNKEIQAFNERMAKSKEAEKK